MLFCLFYRRILKSEPPYPQEMSALSKDIIQRLLMKDPKKRLGCGPTDADEIKQHPFFQVKKKEISPNTAYSVLIFLKSMSKEIPLFW